MQHLVLVGGGHAHVHVLASFGKRPMAGVQVTLVARNVRTPYSGMLPGFVAGRYSFDDCHIDLAALCARTGARLVHAQADGLDLQRRQVPATFGL
jgi:selenide,water dikinase